MKKHTISAPRRHLLAGTAAVAVGLGSLAAAAPAAAETTDPPLLAASTWQGEPNGTFGTSVSPSTCDINGDGLDDTILGDWGWDRPGYTNTGAAYVALGTPAGSSSPSGGDVANPAASGTIRIDGPSVTVPAGAWVGWSVSCLGDVNGDGLDDFVLGAGSRGYQQASVIFGARNFTPVDLDFLGTRGFFIEDSGAADKTTGDKSTDNFGFSVANAGDVDGDGLADIAVGDVLADYNGRTNSGRVWIIKGQTSVRTVDVQADSAKVIRTIDGAAAQDRMAAVSSAGDVNGDGTADLLVGAYSAMPWGPDVASPGAAYALWGGRTGALDLAALHEDGFMIAGPERSRDRLGTSIAGVGDINGDGLDDIAVGADGISRADGPRNGGVAVVFGAASSAPVMTAPEAEGATVFSCSTGRADTGCETSRERGYWIDGSTDGGRTGVSVAGIPDLNADGTPDILIGSAGGAGEAWVAYGARTGSGVLDLAALTQETGALLGTRGGTSIGFAGDINADGSPDAVAGGDNAVSLYLLTAAAPAVPSDPASPAPTPTPTPTPTPGTVPGGGNGGNGGNGEDTAEEGSGTGAVDDPADGTTGTATGQAESGTGPAAADGASPAARSQDPLAATGLGRGWAYVAGAALLLVAAGVWLIRRRRAV
ncbi:integrin alpha [Arthrobacter sp. zg-Y859]|uniref:Integrin alpha n=1 Tax=Arthrobacter jinronghuae TaxID=2964609 RepID=A0ABT1NV01_9MICC|nr:integrin alpha [Arthrobacter jinronghuae]MCQ1951561.1 integrin alpha [Arthrobacter jinronghuae]UWX79636.1 integrin alpha [Arthrobacter jinronghuae]